MSFPSQVDDIMAYKSMHGGIIICVSHESGLHMREAIFQLLGMPASRKKIVYICDIEHLRIPTETYKTKKECLAVDTLIVIGDNTGVQLELWKDAVPIIQTYSSVQSFIENTSCGMFRGKDILIEVYEPSARQIIVSYIQEKTHDAVMEIDLDAIIHNLHIFKSLLLHEVKLMAMIKADGYGCGAAIIAKMLEHHGVDYFGVAYADEGVALRKKGVTAPIVVLNANEKVFDLMLAYNLEIEIYSMDILEAFVAHSGGEKRTIHLNLETGMQRLGLPQTDTSAVVKCLRNHPNITVDSISSHLASSVDSFHDSFSQSQKSMLEATATSIYQGLNITPYPMLHLLNSAGIVRFSDMQYQMVRLGIGLYGVDPSKTLQSRLRHVVTLRTIVLQVKTVNEDDTIGYGRKGVAHQKTIIAVIAIGYADGFYITYSQGKGGVMIRGQYAPVIGNVCMDVAMVDVTKIKNVQVGDTVIIYDHTLPIQERAKTINAIPYELLTSIGKRIERVYRYRGEHIREEL